jgi:hypothetical protein
MTKPHSPLRYDPHWRLVRFERQQRRRHENNIALLAWFLASVVVGAVLAEIILWGQQ